MMVLWTTSHHQLFVKSICLLFPSVKTWLMRLDAFIFWHFDEMISKRFKDNWYPIKFCSWEYQSESELGGSSQRGRLTSYGGGGYVQDLASTKAESLGIILDLRENLWLDRGTRAVFVDFTVYNANINLFCVVKYVFCVLAI